MLNDRLDAGKRKERSTQRERKREDEGVKDEKGRKLR